MIYLTESFVKILICSYSNCTEFIGIKFLHGKTRKTMNELKVIGTYT